MAALEVLRTDLVEVRLRHPAVPDVVGLDRHGDAAAAMLEAARSVHHGAFVAALAEHCFERLVDRLRSLLAAGALRVARRPGIGADEDLALGLRHAERFYRAIFGA